MATFIVFTVMESMKVIHTEVDIILVIHLLYIAYPREGGGGYSWTISYKIYHFIAVIFIGAPLLINCHKVVNCYYLKLIGRQVGVFVFRPPHPLAYRSMFISFSRFFGNIWFKSISELLILSKVCWPFPAQNISDPKYTLFKPCCWR